MATNAEASVSTGALRSIYNDEQVHEPILQCLQIKQLSSRAGNDVERYRTVFSDITNFIQSMLGTNLNNLVTEDIIKKGSFVRIKQFTTNEVKGKKIMIILDCDVLSDLGEREKIGIPVALEEGAPTTTAPVKTEPGQPQQQPGAISSNNFYGNKPQQPDASRNLPTRAGPKSSSHGNIYPIEAVSPYAHNWTIKARVTNKSDIKTWHKASGEGKLFSVNLLDESGEIRATGFNNECDALYPLFNKGDVYYISFPCQVKIANKKFSNLTNDYELTFERDTVVEKAEDEDSVPHVKYNFTTLKDLQTVDKDATIDTIAILQEIGEVSQIVAKNTSKPYDKRELSLVDASGYSTRLTVWGASATSFNLNLNSVVAFKGVKVNDFNGRSLSLLSSGSMTADPDFDEAHRLKGWYDAQGHSENFMTHQNVMGTTSAGGRKDEHKTISAVIEENLGFSETAAYFTLKATLVFVKAENTIAYPACLSEGCNKKVVEENPGEWRCEKCDKTYDKPKYRYVVSVNVADWTGSLWLSCFDETGLQLFGLSADVMQELRDSDDAKYKKTVAEASCKTWVFRVKANLSTFQEQQRVRYQVQSAQPVNYEQESKRLAQMIKQYSINDDSMFVS